MKPELMEELAAIEHKRWSGWHKYVESVSTLTIHGTLLIPRWATDRWQKQAMTEYADLSEKEKEADRIEVRRYERLIDAALLAAFEAGKVSGAEEIYALKEWVYYFRADKRSGDQVGRVNAFISKLRKAGVHKHAVDWQDSFATAAVHYYHHHEIPATEPVLLGPLSEVEQHRLDGLVVQLIDLGGQVLFDKVKDRVDDLINRDADCTAEQWEWALRAELLFAEHERQSLHEEGAWITISETLARIGPEPVV